MEQDQGTQEARKTPAERRTEPTTTNDVLVATKLFAKEATVHDTLKRLHARQHGKGTTIDRFRLNEVVSQIAFGGRSSRVYQQMVSLAGCGRETWSWTWGRAADISPGS
jgi:hypothetical protein